MPFLVQFAFLIAAMGLTVAALGGVFVAFRKSFEPATALQDRVTMLELEVANMREELPPLWETAVERAEEALTNAKKKHASARAQLSTARRLAEGEGDEELEGEPRGDGEAGESQGVLPLSGRMAEPAQDSRPPEVVRADALGLNPWVLQGMM